VTRKTRVAKGGVLYETRQIDDEQPQRSQRPLRANEMIYISNVQTGRSRNPLCSLSQRPIAGQPCQRVTSKSSIPGARQLCDVHLVAPPGCPSARYLRSMELSTKAPDGKMICRPYHVLTLRAAVAVGRPRPIHPGTLAGKLHMARSNLHLLSTDVRGNAARPS